MSNMVVGAHILLMVVLEVITGTNGFFLFTSTVTSSSVDHRYCRSTASEFAAALQALDVGCTLRAGRSSSYYAAITRCRRAMPLLVRAVYSSLSEEVRVIVTSL